MIGLFLFFNIPHIVDLFKNDFVDTDLVYDHPLSHVVFCHACDYLPLLLILYVWW